MGYLAYLIAFALGAFLVLGFVALYFTGWAEHPWMMTLVHFTVIVLVGNIVRSRAAK